MSEVQLPPHLFKPLKQIALNEGFENPEFEYNKGSDIGFTGVLVKCIIKEKDRKLSLMCKFLPEEDGCDQKLNMGNLFEREVFVYQQVLPEIAKVQLDRGLNYRDEKGFWSFPKCYLSEFCEKRPRESFIIMEDLTEESFVTGTIGEPSDFPHTLKIFAELGKLHAVSFVLKFFKPEVFARFVTLKDVRSPLMNSGYMKDHVSRNCQLAADLFKDEHEKYKRDLILSFKNDLWAQVESLLDGNLAEPFGVICHGDCWINNVMFNYNEDEPSQIKDIRLIDFQMMLFGSGSSELMFYLFACTNKQLRDNHQSALIDAYYSSLKDMLELFDMNATQVFPLFQIKEHLKKYGKFAFAMASFLMPIDRKYPEKLFKNPKAQLSKEEKIALGRYEHDMRDVVNDLIDMEAL